MYKNGKRLSGFHSPVSSLPSKKSRLSHEKSSAESTEENEKEKSELAELKNELNNLKEELNEREEILRKLNLVKLYRNKEEFKDLPALTEKWKCCCQQSIQDLHAQLPEPRPSMLELLHNLQIEPSLLNYNVDEDVFET